MRGKELRSQWSGRRAAAAAMKREKKVKPLIEGKGLPPKRAWDTGSSRRQSGDARVGGAGPAALALTWPRTCRATPAVWPIRARKAVSTLLSKQANPRLRFRERWPGLLNN